jgi:hypothetical protein
MKSVIFAMTLLLVICIAAGISGERDAAARATREDSVQVGVVSAVAVAPNGRLSRVETAEGRTYHVYGTPNGMEQSEARIRTATNGVKYLCGGLPDNCSQLVE